MELRSTAAIKVGKIQAGDFRDSWNWEIKFRNRVMHLVRNNGNVGQYFKTVSVSSPY